MIIKQCKYKVKVVIEGFIDDEKGCFAMGGKLNIRPIYQREFVYDNKKQKAVINTILRNLPLNMMYWVKQKDGIFNVLDGQQRTISIANFIKGDFSVLVNKDPMYFSGLSLENKNKILNYQLDIYICEGSEDQVLEWFKTINIMGEPLTIQELRNAIYSGPHVQKAKEYFSKTPHARVDVIGAKYVKAIKNRQEYFLNRWWGSG